MLAGLLGDQVGLRDPDLLFLRVSRQRDDFHPIAQRGGHRVDDVRGGDEQHAREVEGDVEIVVAECPVLLRIEHLEQRRGGIAAEVHAELVDLVEHEDRVLGTRAPQALEDLSGQRADVGPAVAADLRLVTHSAEGDAVELAPERAGDRAPE